MPALALAVKRNDSLPLRSTCTNGCLLPGWVRFLLSFLSFFLTSFHPFLFNITYQITIPSLAPTTILMKPLKMWMKKSFFLLIHTECVNVKGQKAAFHFPALKRLGVSSFGCEFSVELPSCSKNDGIDALYDLSTASVQYGIGGFLIDSYIYQTRFLEQPKCFNFTIYTTINRDDDRALHKITRVDHMAPFRLISCHMHRGIRP